MLMCITAIFFLAFFSLALLLWWTVCVRACVRACVCVCVCVRVRAYVCQFMRERACMFVCVAARVWNSVYVFKYDYSRNENLS